jgi:hypothetical protein
MSDNVSIVLRPEQVELLLRAMDSWETSIGYFDNQITYKTRSVTIAIASCRKRGGEVRDVLVAALAAQPSAPAEGIER